MGGGGPTTQTVWSAKRPWDTANFPAGREPYFAIFKAFIDDVGGKIANIKNKSTGTWTISFFYGDVNEMFHITTRDFELASLFKGSTTIVKPINIHDPLLIPSFKKALGLNDLRPRNIVNPQNRPNKPPIGKPLHIFLVSGGMDSIFMYYTAPKTMNELLIYLDHGQAYKEWELEAIASFGLKVKVIKMPVQREIAHEKFPQGIYESRNLAFMIKLREKYPGTDIVLYFGNNLSDENPQVIFDNNQYALTCAAEAIHLMYNCGTFTLMSPLSNMSKEAISGGLLVWPPIAKSSSFVRWCEGKERLPCGTCHKCLQMKEVGIYDTWTARIPAQVSSPPSPADLLPASPSATSSPENSGS